MTESSDSSDQFSVDRISSLAKLSPVNHAEVGQQLHQILQFAAVFDELELETVEPFFGASDLRSANSDQPIYQPIRVDEPKNCLPRNAALSNAPNQDGEFYVVPPVF